MLWEIQIPGSNTSVHVLLISPLQATSHNFTDNGAHFEFSLSESLESPTYAYTMMTRNVTTYLNGTTVNCTASNTSSVVISVIKKFTGD